MYLFSFIISNIVLKEVGPYTEWNTFRHIVYNSFEFVIKYLVFSDFLPIDFFDFPNIGLDIVFDRKVLVKKSQQNGRCIKYKII